MSKVLPFIGLGIVLLFIIAVIVIASRSSGVYVGTPTYIGTPYYSTPIIATPSFGKTKIKVSSPKIKTSKMKFKRR